MFELTAQEKAHAKMYSLGDSSQVVALAIVLARRLNISSYFLIKDLNETLAAVREVRTGR